VSLKAVMVASGKTRTCDGWLEPFKRSLMGLEVSSRGSDKVPIKMEKPKILSKPVPRHGERRSL